MLQIVFRPGFSRPGHPWVKISKPGHLQLSLVNFVLHPSMKYVAQIPAEEGIKKYNIVTIKAYVWLQGGCFCILQLAEMPCDPQVLPALNWRQARWTGVMWASRWESHVHISRLSVDVVAKVIYSVGQKENKHFTHQLFSCIRIKAFWLVLHDTTLLWYSFGLLSCVTLATLKPECFGNLSCKSLGAGTQGDITLWRGCESIWKYR